MTTAEATSAIIWKYPTAVFSIHSDGADGVVFSSWTCEEFGFDRAPVTAEVQGFIDEWKTSQEYALENFDIVEFQSDLFSLLPSGVSNVDLRLEFGALNTFATNKDFVGLVNYLDFLLDGNIATQDDIEAVEAAVTKQGIILGA